jgi:hypothetical protein
MLAGLRCWAVLRRWRGSIPSGYLTGYVLTYPPVLKLFEYPVAVYNHGFQIIILRGQRTGQRTGDSLLVLLMKTWNCSFNEKFQGEKI